MDVSALTRQLNASVAATVVAATPAEKAPAGPADGFGSRASSSSFPTPPSPPPNQVDITRAVAERVVANIDKPSSGAPSPVSSELWIPTWVRAAYAARARRGWFLPPPTALAGYSHDEPEAARH